MRGVRGGGIGRELCLGGGEGHMLHGDSSSGDAGNSGVGRPLLDCYCRSHIVEPQKVMRRQTANSGHLVRAWAAQCGIMQRESR